MRNHYIPTAITRASIALIIMISAPVVFGLDLTFGETTDSIFSFTLPSSAGYSYSVLSTVPSISLSGDLARHTSEESAVSWEMSVSGKVKASTMRPSLDLLPDTTSLRMWFGAGLSITAGYFSEKGLAAELFPQTAFFGPVDQLGFFENGGKGQARNNEMLGKIGFSNDLLRMTATFAPFRPQLSLPSIESIWFPSVELPESVVISDQTYTMRDLDYQDSVDANPFVPELSFETAVGISTGSFDFDLAYFHGRERQALYSARISEMSTPDTFDLELLSHRGVVDSLAAALTIVSHSWRYWLESSYTLGASAASGSFEFAGIYIDRDSLKVTSIPPVISADKWGMTLGASWQGMLGRWQSRILSEAIWTSYIASEESIRPSLLSKALALTASVEEPSGRFGASCSALVSLLDGSVALRPGLSVVFGGDNSFEIALPLFFGAEDTELGRYSEHKFVFLYLSHRY